MNIYLYVHIVVIVVQYRNVVHQAGNQGSIVFILLWSRASKANFSLTLLTLLSFTIYAISFTILSYDVFYLYSWQCGYTSVLCVIHEIHSPRNTFTSQKTEKEINMLNESWVQITNIFIRKFLNIFWNKILRL